MKKKHGWILINKWNFLKSPLYSAISLTKNIREAFVYEVRRVPRNASFSGFVVRKVELFKNGKAKKIIPGR